LSRPAARPICARCSSGGIRPERQIREHLRQHLSQSPDGLYRERDLIELAILRLMGEWMPLPKAVIAWRDCEADVIDYYADRPLEDATPIDLVVDLHALAADCVHGTQALFERVHVSVPSPGATMVIALGALIHERRAAFWRRARPASDFADDKRRRSARSNSGAVARTVLIPRSSED
jgi:hypothetical protein